jgi:hypothetical protein
MSLEARAEEKKADTKPWLGVYFGAQIPGYVVVKSNPVRSIAWGAVDGALNSDNWHSHLTATCKEASGGGVAVVNIRSMIALGAVPGPSSDSPKSIITNGMVKVYEGDCVTEVERLKR